MNKLYFNGYQYNTRIKTDIKRIDKKQARRAYNNGLSVLFIPCNLTPVSPWGLGIWENKNLDGQYKDFETLVNMFQYYNCTATTGKYTAFYIPVTVDNFDNRKTYNYKILEG